MRNEGRALKVYVSSPYGRRRNLPEEDIERNVDFAIEVGRKLLLEGFIPVVPHAFHFLHKNWKDSPEESTWLKLCLGLLDGCDIFLSLGDSYGCEKEKERALELGQPICYSIDEVKQCRQYFKC